MQHLFSIILPGLSPVFSFLFVFPRKGGNFGEFCFPSLSFTNFVLSFSKFCEKHKALLSKGCLDFCHCEKLVGESITKIRLVLNFHLMHPYFDNALTLGFYRTPQNMVNDSRTKIHKPHSNFSLFLLKERNCK